MSFKWSDDLITGMPEIDAQHRALIGQFNDLIAACAQKKGPEEVGRFVTFLTGYVHRHFDDEERIMADVSYTGLARHQEQHAKFRERLTKLKNNLGQQGATDEVAAEAVWVAAEWFVDHIRQVDMAMAGALRSRKH